MYQSFGMGSCSALIHTFAAYPKLIGSLIVAGTLLVTSTDGSCQFDRTAFDQAAQSYQISSEEQAVLTDGFATVSNRPLNDSEISSVLKMLKCDCAGVVPQEIRKDPVLLREVGFIHFVSLVQQYDLEEAKRRY